MRGWGSHVIPAKLLRGPVTWEHGPATEIAVRQFTCSALPPEHHAAGLPPSAQLRAILRALLRAI